MRSLLNPKWLFVINTLPIVVLFFLVFGQFNIIKTLLDEDNIRLWKLFGLALGILGLLNFAYAAYLTFRKQNVSALYGIVALIGYISFTYLYAFHLFTDKIIPSGVPQWMISGNIFIYVGTFLMPTLAYSVFVLISHFTPETKKHRAWVNFLLAIAVPLAGYLFSQIILPLWQHVNGDFLEHTLLILVIVATLVFLFFLARGVFIIATKKSVAWQKYQLAWKIPIAIVLPLLGLLVNNGLLFNDFQINDSGIFGDFNGYWFYGLALANGILVCLPNLNSKLYRLLLFAARSITFAYTFYFFLVFLPFLPLSVIAIILIGTGFLMLTPLMLFVIHANELSKDFTFLKAHFSKKLAFGILLLGFLVIPAFITAIYLKDRRVLKETLAYIYSPDYSKQYHIDKNSLFKTLNVLKSHKKNNGGGIFGSQQPYLSSYFSWLVLDNLTLSDTKISYIEKIFFGNTSSASQAENIQNENVKITNIKSNSTYDKSQNAWKSWVDLEITNKSEYTWLQEYATSINLPDGCWISDYYLYVGDKKEQGFLSEKKSAMWVFSQIRNESRDPGILYYLTGNKVAFRVFPFERKEVRKTGIEFLHNDPVKLTIDGYTVELGMERKATDDIVETKNVVYVSARQKKFLKQVCRKPYFHFLVDVSEGKEQLSQEFTNRIKQICEQDKPLSENAQISFVNSYVSTFSLENGWAENLQSQVFDGAFYLDRAIKTALFNAYKKETYPVMVVVTDSIQNAVWDKDFSDFKPAFPESNLFYNLGKDGVLRAHSLVGEPAKQLPDMLRECMFCETVLAYQLSDNSTAYLPSNNEASIILKNDIFEIDETEIKEKSWQSGLIMQGSWQSQVLHPEIADKEWLSLVKYSFVSNIMMPVSSYLVVENEAQKAALEKKQQRVLASNHSLDIGEDTPDFSEDTQQMSEPDFWVLAILFGVALWYRRKTINN
jgi:hypothetical protein